MTPADKHQISHSVDSSVPQITPLTTASKSFLSLFVV
jgi:hypothetical protein